MIGEEPDYPAAGCGYWARINRATGTNHGKDFVLLQRKRDPNLPRNVKRIVGIIFEIGARIELDPRAGVIFKDIFVSDERMNRLQVIGQSIVVAYDPAQRAPRHEQTIMPIVTAEVESFVLSSEAQIPVAGNQKAVGVGDLVVDRIAVPELSTVVLIIATEAVGRLVLKNVEMIYLLFARGRCRPEVNVAGSAKDC